MIKKIKKTTIMMIIMMMMKKKKKRERRREQGERWGKLGGVEKESRKRMKVEKHC